MTTDYFIRFCEALVREKGQCRMVRTTFNEIDCSSICPFHTQFCVAKDILEKAKEYLSENGQDRDNQI